MHAYFSKIFFSFIEYHYSQLYVHTIYKGHSIIKGSFFKKSKIFFISALFGIGLKQKLFQSHKNICFEAIQNEGKSYRMLKVSTEFAIKFLVAEKCEPCEVYRRMCDVCKEACFESKNVYKWVKHVLLLWVWIKKTVHGAETHWLSGKAKVPGTSVSKEGNADSLLRYEKTHHNWFPWKRYNFKQCFLLPTP